MDGLISLSAYGNQLLFKFSQAKFISSRSIFRIKKLPEIAIGPNKKHFYAFNFNHLRASRGHFKELARLN